MAVHKQKWTPEEEAALKAGVAKFGPGKWKMILKDPEFACVLQKRSNVDLKDKWRNINFMGSGYRSRHRSTPQKSRPVHKPEKKRPVKGMAMLPPLPPKPRTMSGRLSGKRKRDASEIEGAHSLSKVGKNVKSGLCKTVCHSRTTCKDAQKKLEPKSKKGKRNKTLVVEDSVREQPHFVQSVEQLDKEPIVEQPVQVPGPLTHSYNMHRRGRRSERIIKKKLAKRVYDKDGGGRSIEKPVKLE